jgi:ubiquinone/menaquinone biosynthesis C-methylase UbiE
VEGLSIELRCADAEAPGLADATFDVGVSTFGVTFTPDHDKAAAELVRVCKSGWSKNKSEFRRGQNRSTACFGHLRNNRLEAGWKSDVGRT